MGAFSPVHRSHVLSDAALRPLLEMQYENIASYALEWGTPIVPQQRYLDALRSIAMPPSLFWITPATNTGEIPDEGNDREDENDTGDLDDDTTLCDAPAPEDVCLHDLLDEVEEELEEQCHTVDGDRKNNAMAVDSISEPARHAVDGDQTTGAIAVESISEPAGHLAMAVDSDPSPMVVDSTPEPASATVDDDQTRSTMASAVVPGVSVDEEAMSIPWEHRLLSTPPVSLCRGRNCIEASLIFGTVARGAR